MSESNHEGVALKKYRIQNRLSLQDFKEKCGVSIQSIAHYERTGEAHPKDLKKLKKALSKENE